MYAALIAALLLVKHCHAVSPSLCADEVSRSERNNLFGCQALAFAATRIASVAPGVFARGREKGVTCHTMQRHGSM